MQKSTLDQVYISLLKLLTKTKSCYLIIGGLAQGVLGEPRLTQDIDVLIMLEEDDIDKFLKIAQKDGFKVSFRKAKETISLQGFFKIALGSFSVDFIIGSSVFEKSAFSRKRRFKLYNRYAFFPSPEDFILFKLISGREKDILDIKSVIIRHGNKLDKKYLTNWAQEISDQLQDFRVCNQLKKLLTEL
jgi:hypothetical protein